MASWRTTGPAHGGRREVPIPSFGGSTAVRIARPLKDARRDEACVAFNGGHSSRICRSFQISSLHVPRIMAGMGIAPLIWLLLAAGPAAETARPPPITVEFAAPPGCSSVGASHAGLLSRSRRARRASAGEEASRLFVQLTRATGRVYGELRVLERSGETYTRKVEGDNCDEVVRVLSLTAALAMEASSTRAPPTLARDRSPQNPAPAPSSAPPNPPPAVTSVVPQPTEPLAIIAAPGDGDRDERRLLTLRLAVSTAAGQVIRPSLDFGGAISARVTRPRGGSGPSLTAAAVYVSNDLVRPATDVAIALTAASITGCPGWATRGAIVVEPCVQAFGGRLTATGRGLTDPNSVSRRWWSVGALARASMALGRGFFVELEAGLQAPLARRRFATTTPERTVGETPALCTITTIGISRSM